MGPKYGQPSGKLVKVEASELNEAPSPVSPRQVDPLAHLRYTPSIPPSAPTAPLVRRYRRIPVLKKRISRTAHFTNDKPLHRKSRYSDNIVSFADEYARQGRLQQKKKAPDPPTLPLDMVCPRLLTPWFEAPIVTATKHQPTEALLRKQPVGRCYLNSINASLGREGRSLIRYQQMKENQMQVEDFLMSATGKTRGNLLIRKKQLLPKITPDGCEQDLMKIERTVTPEELTLMEFFSAGDSKYRIKSDISPVVPRRERGYSIVTDWFGCPQVTDVIRAKLGLGSDNIENSHSLMDQVGSMGSEFVPMMATLGLVSGSLKPKITVSRCLEEMSQRGTTAKIEDVHLMEVSQTRRVSCPSHQTYCETSFPSLMVGDTALTWSTDHRRPDKPLVIELGCTAELGRNAISSLTMTNTGPTVIRISWVKKEHQDKLGLSKYITTRFVFDSEARSILPSESFRISFAYRSIQLGYYSEDWQMVTRPILENGERIIVRLWGITVATDSFKEERNVVDAVIKRREALTIVRKGLDELLEILPTKEVIFREKRVLPALLGPDLFLYRNPRLNYMTTEVYRLGKLVEMAEAKKERPGKSITGGLFFAALSAYRSKSISHEAVAPETAEKDPDSSVEEADDDDVSDNSEETQSSVQTKSATSVRPSIATFKTLIRRVLNTDLMRRNLGSPRKRLDNVEEDASSPAEPHNEKSATWDVRRFPTAPINVVNPDFCVDRLRDLIIAMEDNMEEQEAYFYLMNENLEKLNFRPELAQPDLKLFHGRALLAEAVDKFNEYAVSLKVQCCLSQTQKQSFTDVKEAVKANSSLTDTSDGESTRSFLDENFNVSFNEESKMSVARTIPGDDMPEEDLNVSANEEPQRGISKTMSRQAVNDSPALEEASVIQLPKKFSINDGHLRSLRGSLMSNSISRPMAADVFRDDTVAKLVIAQKSTTEQLTTLTCPEMNAKLAFDSRRYKCHYYNGLYGRMYQVLSEFLDNLDHVLASLERQEPLKMNSEVVFTRKRAISRTDKNVDELLNAPLPPNWVKVAQRMEAVYAAIKERRGVTNYTGGSVN
ncbi:unnamed protein product [Lymnaea stagnalis]|uniref:MYCBP-associated protein n=1 Tax=Lymnaea stagnalis TaxID=6523 RepID=A0AAV2HIC2_LYMST